ncbi:hypothetical protein CWC46_10165 [Prodigiosinella confusarubida]|uniref:Glycosaminoglycan attachment site n=1 Tax=Serratia sp. (strain ATCC 39006) TaxID=104623 RepID=A0A2I5TIT6_SERS3|nr:hypothetical protein [Serratia sp. ATCC 39006]AUH00133.1 hypothetical protein CWC46_10165 [Serratia sp. ATCC 39006]AUH04452.1 hypothetical protein Ser39006_010170 [Serratia sp. ATCC 39006]
MDFFLPLVNEDKFHENFKRVLLKNDKLAQNLFNKWAAEFVDRDNKIIKEFQTSFNSTFWEVYLHAALKHYGLSVDFTFSSPDFCIPDAQIVIEATTANAAKDKTPEWDKKYTTEEMAKLNRFGELNREAMVRISNAIKQKEKKYSSSYSKLDHVKGKSFVLAVAPFEQPYFNLQYDRAIRAVLYSDYINEDAYLDNPELYPDGPPNQYLDYITKDNGTEIPLGFFCDEQYENISAVMFNCNATWGKVVAIANKNNPLGQISSVWAVPPTGKPKGTICKPSEYNENILDGLMIFHNPYAKKPLSPSIFKSERVVQFFPDYKTKTLQVENYNDCLHSRTVIIANIENEKD